MRSSDSADPPAQPPAEPPAAVRALAAEREAARGRRDYATADRLRAEILAAGWQLRDGPDGPQLAPAPPYPVLDTAGELPDRSGDPDTRRASVAVLVEGWPDDVTACLAALLTHAPADVGILALDLGNRDGAGDALHAIATTAPDRVEAWHLAAPVGWAAARAALLRADPAAIQVWCEPSTLLTGDALTPLFDALADPGVVAAGWRGVDVDLADDWRSFMPAGPGEVDALLGYLLAVRRSAALTVGGPHPKARFYRNADMEFCLLLREARLGRIVVPDVELPVRQTRHRGYHDTDPAYRDRESKRTYDRILARFRGRVELLAPRPPGSGVG